MGSDNVNKKPHYAEEKLLKLYGSKVIEQACTYFNNRNEHFTIDKFKLKCKEIWEQLI